MMQVDSQKKPPKNKRTLADRISLRYCLPASIFFVYRCSTEAFRKIHWETPATPSDYWSWTSSRLFSTPGWLSIFKTYMKYRTGMTNNVHRLCTYAIQWRIDILQAAYGTRRLMYTCSRLSKSVLKDSTQPEFSCSHLTTDTPEYYAKSAKS